MQSWKNLITMGCTRLLLVFLALCLPLLPKAAFGQVDWGSEDKAPQKPKRKACPEGKERSPDTQGQCCWPGQAWNGLQCVGTPLSCPPHLVPDEDQQACVLEGCLAEMVLTSDGVHCCWPGQAWSSAREMCIGKPTCPESYVEKEGSCIYVAPDEDHDQIADFTDDCPTEKEDHDGFEDKDGCPDEDNDRDQILDKDDQCPDLAEDLDEFEDKDGCPELDNDKDGVEDDKDLCPLTLEDLDSFEDHDGCPDEDNDRDGIVDEVDQCPNHAEDLNDFMDTDGCPDKEEAEAAADLQTLATLGWVAIGVGVAFGGTSLGLHLVAESKRDEFRNAEVDERSQGITSLTYGEAKELEETANNLDTGAAISLGLGIASLLAGTSLLLFHSDPSETQAFIDLEHQVLGFKRRF